MKSLSALFSALFLFLTTPASAQTIGFEDLSKTNTFATLPSPYAGLEWINFKFVYQGYEIGHYGTNHGYHYGTTSGNYAAFGHNPVSQIIATDNRTFDFTSAYLTSAWQTQSITFNGYLNDQKRYSLTAEINTTKPLLVNFDWMGIDQLIITHTGNQWVIDDMTIQHKEVVTSVPEPSSLLLTLSGLALIGLSLYKKKLPLINLAN